MKNELTQKNHENLIGECSIKYSETQGSPKTAPHIHNAYEITLILSDDVVLEVNGASYPIPRGSILLFNTMDVHRIRYNGSATYKRFVLWFKQDFLDEVEGLKYKLLRCFFLRNFERANLLPLNDERVDEIARMYRQLKKISQSDGYMKTVRLKLALADFLITVNDLYLKYNEKILPAYQKEYVSVYKAILYIQENYSSQINRGTLARLTGLDERRLCDYFKSVTGMTTNQYILNFRINAAKNLLLQGLQTSEVCELVGFDNYSNFSRTFKKHVGISPKQYYMSYKE